MEITAKKHEMQVLNALLYIVEYGCQRRGFPKTFGRWHRIYMRANRWAKQGVLDDVVIALREKDIIAKYPAKSPTIYTAFIIVTYGKNGFFYHLSLPQFLSTAVLTLHSILYQKK